MRKEEYYKFMGIPFVPTEPISDRERPQIEGSDSAQAILQAIYALDPVTKLPTGDIMCYLSSQTPPEIKQYIMDNLMIDISKQALPKMPDGLDDDTAFVLERRLDESLDSYRSRVSNFMQQQVDTINMAAENAKRKSSKPDE